MGYACGMCEKPESGVVITTNLTTGQTTSTCSDCLPIALVGYLAAVLEVDPNALYDHVRKWVTKQERDAEKARQALDREIDEALTVLTERYSEPLAAATRDCLAKGHTAADAPQTCPYQAELHGDKADHCLCCAECRDNCQGSV